MCRQRQQQSCLVRVRSPLPCKLGELPRKSLITLKLYHNTYPHLTVNSEQNWWEEDRTTYLTIFLFVRFSCSLLNRKID